MSLIDELESWIAARVSSGLYRSSSEVIREALRVLREREELKEIRRDEFRKLVRAGLEDFEAERFVDFDEALVEEIKAAGRRRLANKK